MAVRHLPRRRARSRVLAAGPPPWRTSLGIRLAEPGGTGLLAPAYLGTWTRSFYPGPDTAAAAEEVAELIDRLRAAQPRASTSVVAESAGAWVALRFLRQRGVPTVLAVPSPASARDLVSDTDGTDIPSGAASQRVAFYRYRPGTQDPELVEATSGEQIAAFVGNDFARDLGGMIQALPPQRRHCLAIVYGTEDRRVRNDRLAAIRRAFPFIAVRAVGGMGHGARTEEQAVAFARAVAESLPTRCS